MENVEEVLIMSDSGYPTSDQSEGRRGSGGSGGSRDGGSYGTTSTGRTHGNVRSATRPTYYRWYTGADGKLKYGGNSYPVANVNGGGRTMHQEPQRSNNGSEKYNERDKQSVTVTVASTSAGSAQVQHLPYGYGGFNPAKNVVEQDALSQEEERKQVG